ncbi:hypothetical protein KP509_30G039700 [Ceratopteris richardii]|nr:hypothetical protein KP509_30G039700 [Ceratopteris richardii]
MRKLVQVQAFCIANLHAENEESLGEISSALSAEIEQKNAELQEQASSRMKAKDEARLKFEEEKAALETSLREELVACQICMQNPRNVVIMPCLHAQFCKECLTQNKDTNDNNCPSCRCPIVSSFPYIC